MNYPVETHLTFFSLLSGCSLRAKSRSSVDFSISFPDRCSLFKFERFNVRAEIRASQPSSVIPQSFNLQKERKHIPTVQDTQTNFWLWLAEYFKCCDSTRVSAVYIEDSAVHQTTASLLSLLWYCQTNSALSALRGLMSEPNPEHNNLCEWYHNQSACTEKTY